MNQLTPECIQFYDVKYHTYVFIPKSKCRLHKHETSRGEKLRVVGEYQHPDGVHRTVSKFVGKDFSL